MKVNIIIQNNNTGKEVTNTDPIEVKTTRGWEFGRKVGQFISYCMSGNGENEDLVVKIIKL
jgi:hypothetical protein